MRAVDGPEGADGAACCPGGGGPLPVGGDASGTTDAITVEAVQGVPWSATPPAAPGMVPKWSGTEVAWAADATGVDYSAALWVDPSGDPASDGKAPAKPTTIANAATTIAAGGTIVLAPGVYASPTISVAGVTLTSLVAQSTPSGAASVRLTGTLVLTERNTRIVGIQLGSLDDQSGSAGAGSTVLEQCSLIGNITVSNPAGTQVSLLGCSFADITVAGTNTLTTIRLRDCQTGGTITNATTGTVVTIANASNFAAITQTAAGTQAIELVGCFLSGGVTRSAGTTSTITLRATQLVGAIDATGAAAATVKIIASTFNRAGSTIPVGAEDATANPTRDSALEYGSTVPALWNGVAPTIIIPAIDKIVRGEFAYGQPEVPPLVQTGEVSTTAIIVPPDFSAAVVYASAFYPVVRAGVYESITTFFCGVTNTNTRYYFDIWVGGSPSPIGYSSFQLGAADSFDNRHASVQIVLPIDVPVLIELKFGKLGGTGAAIMRYAYNALVRRGNFP